MFYGSAHSSPLPCPPCQKNPSSPPEFAVTLAVVTPVEEIICASGRVITEAECEIAVTKLCLRPREQPQTSDAFSTLITPAPLSTVSLLLLLPFLSVSPPPSLLYSFPFTALKNHINSASNSTYSKVVWIRSPSPRN